LAAGGPQCRALEGAARSSLTFSLSMIFSENRCPFFGIML
jgi:hypothetical protein